MDRRRWRIEADTIGEAAVFVRVVGEDQGDFAVRWGGAAQAGPVCDQLRDKVDPVAHRLIGRDRAFRRLVEIGGTFEADGAGQDAAVDLWQGDVHGDVAGGQALGGGAPCVFGPAGQDDLEDGSVIGNQRVGRAIIAVMRAADGECGGVQDRGGRGLAEQLV